MKTIPVSTTDPETKQSKIYVYDYPTLKQKIPYHCFIGKKKYHDTFGADVDVKKGEILYSAEENPASRTAEDLVFRVLCNWHLANIQSISRFTDYSEDRVRDALRKLMGDGYVMDLGRIKGMLSDEFRGNFFTPQYKHEKDFGYVGDLLCYAGRKYSHPKFPSINSYEYPMTYDNYGIERHIVGSGERCSRIIWYLNKYLGHGYETAFAYSEQALRAMFGWYDPRRDPKTYENSPQLFRTTIPDAWIVFGGYSIRYEYFRSVPSEEDIRIRLATMPPGEMMLAVVESSAHRGVPSAQTEKVLTSFQNDILDGRLRVVRFHNGTPVEIAAHKQQLEDFLKCVHWNMDNKRHLLSTPTSEAEDPENINIRELTLHYSQGWFLRTGRKVTNGIDRVRDYDGKIIPQPFIRKTPFELPKSTVNYV